MREIRLERTSDKPIHAHQLARDVSRIYKQSIIMRFDQDSEIYDCKLIREPVGRIAPSGPMNPSSIACAVRL